MSDLKFRTSEECLVKLVASTKFVDGASDVTEDYLPVTAARVSFGADGKTGKNVEADKKLMKYLADNKHVSPFEHLHATFVIECPLFVRSQIHRHRTFSYNEISRRYTDDDLGFWMPSKWRAQSKSNKQGSVGEVDINNDQYYAWCYHALLLYNELLDSGVCREQARAVLPQSLLTRFYMTGNLRNWAHFLELRLDAHAQAEVRVVAEKIEASLRQLWPEAMQALLPVTSD